MPLAVLRPAGNDDYESVQMSTNPKFIEMLERSRKSIGEGRDISLALCSFCPSFWEKLLDTVSPDMYPAVSSK